MTINLDYDNIIKSSTDIQQEALRIGDIASDIELNLKNVQNELKPELEVIESRVILPCYEVIQLVENARKLVVKRKYIISHLFFIE